MNTESRTDGTERELWERVKGSPLSRVTNLGEEDDGLLIDQIKQTLRNLHATLVEKSLVPEWAAYVYRIGEQLILLSPVDFCGIELVGPDPAFTTFLEELNRVRSSPTD